MADAVADTDIMIDLLRNHPSALTWVEQNSSLKIGIPTLVWLEVLLGAQNKAEQERALKMLNQFEVLYLEGADNEWAMEQFLKFHLSHNIGVHDVLIAAVSVRLQLPIFTRNVKHFSPLPNVQVVTPY